VINPGFMRNPEREIVEQKIRRAVGINALRKIGAIVAEERQTDVEKEQTVRWFVRYGWVVLLCAALLLAYFMGVI
jgi:hypothetical protein